MVGPRQVGKTTLAKFLLNTPKDGDNYFNWDNPEHRNYLLKDVFRSQFDFHAKEHGTIVFDEIHKYPRWKNTLKGLFDVNEPDTHWIVTGSAALNIYRKGQDSLVGRHFTYTLHPLSVAEILARKKIGDATQIFDFSWADNLKNQSHEALTKLMEFTGFPEPYFKADPTFLRQWRAARRDRLINQDLAALENIQNLSLVEHLTLLLPERVGSPLSINALREDLELHFTTVKKWLESLARIFYGFFLRPYTPKLTRTLKKESKWYLWDWSEIENQGARFENLTAIHLKKTVDYVNDLGLGDWGLFYVRDREKREVDFLITKNRKPHIAVECKLSDDNIPASLVYFAERLKIERCFVVVFDPETRHRTTIKNGITIEVIPAWKFFAGLV